MVSQILIATEMDRHGLGYEQARRKVQSREEIIRRGRHRFPTIPQVAMPVDVNDEELFPEMAAARAYARERGLV